MILDRIRQAIAADPPPWWGNRTLGPFAIDWHYEIPTWWNAGLRHGPTGIGIELSADSCGLDVRFCWAFAPRELKGRCKCGMPCDLDATVCLDCQDRIAAIRPQPAPCRTP